MGKKIVKRTVTVEEFVDTAEAGDADLDAREDDEEGGEDEEVVPSRGRPRGAMAAKLPASTRSRTRMGI